MSFPFFLETGHDAYVPRPYNSNILTQTKIRSTILVRLLAERVAAVVGRGEQGPPAQGCFA